MDKVYIENTTLAFTINKRLVKLGIRDSLFPFNGVFTQEELNNIDSIVIVSSDTFEKLSILRNLESLCVVKDDNIVDDVNKNIDEINKLTNLRQLHILGDVYLKNLNISNLKKLESLRLINNVNLTDVIGLSSLTNLKEVIITGNNIKEIDNIKTYIDNTKDTKINILDFNVFDKTFGKNIKNRKYLESKLNSGYSNISFGEMLYFDDECYKIDYYQMLTMYNKASKIIKNLDLKNDSDIDKAYKIHSYIVNNLSYSYDELEMRNKLYDQIKLNKDDNEYLKKRILTINSSYSAIMGKKSVCDGYVNVMKLLLNMCDIESRKVKCTYFNSNSIKPDHVIIKYYIDNDWYYDDPEKEQKNEKDRFFALDIDQIQKTHILTDEEIARNNFNKNVKVLKRGIKDDDR